VIVPQSSSKLLGLFLGLHPHLDHCLLWWWLVAAEEEIRMLGAPLVRVAVRVEWSSFRLMPFVKGLFMLDLLVMAAL